MKNPEVRKPDTIHQLGIELPEIPAGHTSGLITYGTSPESAANRRKAIAPVIENNKDLSSRPDIDGARILASQIQVLNAIFNRYSQIAIAVMDLNPRMAEGAMHLALRAQNETRRSIATLNELRNPRKTTFIKKNIERQQNNLITGGQNATLDERSTIEAIGGDQELEAVGVEYGGNHAGG
ncbi:MAG: hypothetical protein KME18_09405 [Phormidium tanganyikae FI6-MK23]|nr:hypothetical protein [Phormidium tanganyikae FI6-MK23]